MHEKSAKQHVNLRKSLQVAQENKDKLSNGPHIPQITTALKTMVASRTIFTTPAIITALTTECKHDSPNMIKKTAATRTGHRRRHSPLRQPMARFVWASRLLPSAGRSRALRSSAG
jgi:hypothetical protein